MGLLGLADDLRPLPALWRLVTHTAIAILAVRVLGPVSLPWLPPWLASVLTMFWIVAVSNAVNFMDGVDGMAGAQAVVAGIGWAAVAAIAGWRDAALLGLLVALASAGFLFHNWQPARVFMGDAGSGFLGCLLAVLPLTTPEPSTASAWTGVLLMWPFLFDTGFTLVRRVGRGENVFTAHRSHLYQRFTLTERSHQDVVVFYAALASLGMLAAVLLAAAQPLPAIAAIGAIPIAAFSLWRAVTAREALRRTAARP
jgi:UDP-N-acetylmuramyl pentapeptide phosphotransferase/UDP-N-acetylglucosamine-1-phosphate transferase